MAFNSPTCAYLAFDMPSSKKFEFLVMHFLYSPAVDAVNLLEALGVPPLIFLSLQGGVPIIFL